MPDNFTAEDVSSAGEIFATDQRSADAVHFPIGKIAWGALGSFVLTDTSNPFPVKLFGDASIAVDSGDIIRTKMVESDSNGPVFAEGDSAGTARFFAVGFESNPATNLFSVVSSATPLPVRGDTVVTVTGYTAPSTTATVSQAAGTSFQVTHAGLTAIDSAINSSNEMLVKVSEIDSAWTGYDASNSALRVNVVAGSAAGSSTVTVSNDSSDPIGVTNISADPLFIRGVTDSTIPVSGSSTSAIGTALNAVSGNSAGALETFSTVLSSDIETVTSSAARLYGYMITNPDTAAIVYAKVFADDSTGVTKGTTAATLNLGIPPEGGANVTFPQGVLMSSGISLLAAGGAGLSDTSAPSTSLVVNFFYKG